MRRPPLLLRRELEIEEFPRMHILLPKKAPCPFMKYLFPTHSPVCCKPLTGIGPGLVIAFNPSLGLDNNASACICNLVKEKTRAYFQQHGITLGNAQLDQLIEMGGNTLCTLKQLTDNLDLSQNEVNFLLSQPFLMVQLDNFLKSHPGNQIANIFARFVLQELDANPAIPSNINLGQYNFFDNFDATLDYLNANTTTEQALNNGITIDYITQAPPYPPAAGRLLGGSEANPNGGQDAIGRTNGDINILPVFYQVFDLDPEWVLKSRGIVAWLLVQPKYPLPKLGFRQP